MLLCSSVRAIVRTFRDKIVHVHDVGDIPKHNRCEKKTTQN